MKIYLMTILDEPSLPHHEGKPIKVDLDNYFISNILKATTPCKEKKRVDLFERLHNEKKKKERNTGVQVTISNDPYPIVTHLQALTRKELPAAYLKSNLPRVRQYGDTLFAGDGYILLKIGEAYHPKILLEALKYIRLAGEHLAIVNKETNWPRQKTTTFKDGRLT